MDRWPLLIAFLKEAARAGVRVIYKCHIEDAFSPVVHKPRPHNLEVVCDSRWEGFSASYKVVAEQVRCANNWRGAVQFGTEAVPELYVHEPDIDEMLEAESKLKPLLRQVSEAKKHRTPKSKVKVPRHMAPPPFQDTVFTHQLFTGINARPRTIPQSVNRVLAALSVLPGGIPKAPGYRVRAEELKELLPPRVYYLQLVVRNTCRHMSAFEAAGVVKVAEDNMARGLVTANLDSYSLQEILDADFFRQQAANADGDSGYDGSEAPDDGDD